MARSVWKGPFVELSLLKKAEAAQDKSSRTPIKTWSRRSTILPQFVGLTFHVYHGRKVEEALNILKFSPKGMADDVRKVLASAVANAENNHNLDVDALVVAEASVGKSLSMKRFATRARGRSSRIVKPFSQIRVVVREQEEA